MMTKRLISILFLIWSLASYGQGSVYYNADSTVRYLPIAIDSIVMSDSFIPTRCVNKLSDSLSLLEDSFQDRLFATTFDTAIGYTYQFTKTVNIVISYQSKLSGNRECFSIENNKNINEFLNFNEFICYNKNEWLIVVVNGIPRIGNSTYITNYYIYFKRN